MLASCSVAGAAVRVGGGAFTAAACCLRRDGVRPGRLGRMLGKPGAPAGAIVGRAHAHRLEAAALAEKVEPSVGAEPHGDLVHVRVHVARHRSAVHRSTVALRPANDNGPSGPFGVEVEPRRTISVCSRRFALAGPRERGRDEVPDVFEDSDDDFLALAAEPVEAERV